MYIPRLHFTAQKNITPTASSGDLDQDLATILALATDEPWVVRDGSTPIDNTTDTRPDQVSVERRPGYVIMDTSGGLVVQTLPAIDESQDGRVIVFKRSGGNVAQLDPDGTNTIEGAASYNIAADADVVTIKADLATADWKIVGEKN